MTGEQPTCRDLWGRIRDHLPKKGRGTDAVTGDPRPPAELEGALQSLYINYNASGKDGCGTTGGNIGSPRDLEEFGVGQGLGSSPSTAPGRRTADRSRNPENLKASRTNQGLIWIGTWLSGRLVSFVRLSGVKTAGPGLPSAFQMALSGAQ